MEERRRHGECEGGREGGCEVVVGGSCGGGGERGRTGGRRGLGLGLGLRAWVVGLMLMEFIVSLYVAIRWFSSVDMH